MNKNALTLSLLLAILFCLTGTYVYAQSPLSQLYSSGLYSDNQVDILVNSLPGETVLIEAPGGISLQPMQSIWNNSWQTASVTMPPHPYIGFRNEYPSLRVNPVFWNSTMSPSISYYSPLESDPTGDHLFTSNWLDITSSRVSFSSDRLYFAITNNHGSFPVSSGLTFFAYMPVLVNPDALPEDNPIVYGLMYTVDMAGIIAPGLYKISGTGFDDLLLLGEIEYSIENQSLLLSCSMADLLADPDFASWYNPAYPRLTTTTTSSKISLISGTQQADMTAGAELLLLPQAIPMQNQFAPVLSEAVYQVSPGNPDLLGASIVYTDADNNYPRLASISIDGGEEYPLFPEMLPDSAFSTGVVYQMQNIPQVENWQELRFRFSDGDGFVEHTLASGSGVEDETQNPIPQLQLYPNPTGNYLKLKFSSKQQDTFCIYNLRGQKLGSYTLQAGNTSSEVDVSKFVPGVYFVKSASAGSAVRRFVKL